MSKKPNNTEKPKPKSPPKKPAPKPKRGGEIMIAKGKKPRGY